MIKTTTIKCYGVPVEVRYYETTKDDTLAAGHEGLAERYGIQIISARSGRTALTPTEPMFQRVVHYCSQGNHCQLQ